MLRFDQILGHETDGALAERLHELEHRGQVENIKLEGDDILRRRLRVLTDRGTEFAFMHPREERLSIGAVLLVEAERAIVIRREEAQRLCLVPRDQAAALELGYLAEHALARPV